jgi:DNA ligase (NAD+)
MSNNSQYIYGIRAIQEAIESSTDFHKIFLQKGVTSPLFKKIVPPTNCPACSSVLEFVNDQLFCKNNLCPAQSAKKLEHFAKTLKIKGLGPATIARLGLEDYHDIYSLSQEEISFLLDSEKLGTKLHAEIEKSKGVDLITLLPAFSIPLIGTSASNKLAKHISALSEITPEQTTADGS